MGGLPPFQPSSGLSSLLDNNYMKIVLVSLSLQKFKVKIDNIASQLSSVAPPMTNAQVPDMDEFYSFHIIDENVSMSNCLLPNIFDIFPNFDEFIS